MVSTMYYYYYCYYYYYYECVSGKAAVQNGTVSGQTMLDHSADTAAVNGVLASDGDVPAAVTEEDAVVRIHLHFTIFTAMGTRMHS